MLHAALLSCALAASAGDAGSSHDDLFGSPVVPGAQGSASVPANGSASADAGLAIGGPAAGAGRDDEMFGGPQTEPASTSSVPGAPEAAGGSFESRAAVSSTLPPDNPLTIGGQLYLRTQLSATEHEPPSQYQLSAQFLLDVYLDARPNDRVRGFVLVRTFFDPTYNPAAPLALNLFGTAPPAQANPAFLLDQLWLKFDVDRKVFVTAGRQHVKWGTAHFWFPNDLLNPTKLSPLAVFDQRTGVTMVKANLPVELLHLNLTGVGLLEGLQQANQFGKIGGAGRAEVVLDTLEAGLDFTTASNQHGRYGGDVSFGLGDFDLYAEGVLIDGRDNPVYQELSPPDLTTDYLGSYQLNVPSGYQPQVAAGLNWSYRYGNNRLLTFGGEYFYDGLGTNTPSIYPWLLLHNDFVPFYVGQHYAGLYVLADKPGSWYNSTVNFSTLANLSDRSILSRIDFFQQVLTHLRVEAFVDVHYGDDGEFNLSFSTNGGNVAGFTVPAFNVNRPIFDVGGALRLAI